jgi:hypothetical protein
MRFIFLLPVLIICNLCIAQSDEHPDFRSKKELFTRITEKDIRADVASYSMGGMDESVGKLPLKIIPITESSANFISFAGDDIQVTISSAPFEPSKHKLTYDDKFLIKIDNKGYFGNYGKIPKTQVDKVIVIIGRDTVIVPPAACVDLCNPIFSFTEGGMQKSQNKVFVSADGRKIYVYMLKPEAGGSYEATWIIQDKKYLKRVVDFGFLR